MTGLSFRLQIAGVTADSQARDHLEHARVLVGELISRVRNLSQDLRPPILSDLGLVPALRWLFGLHKEDLNLDVFFEHSASMERRFDPEIETATYRITQEAITNASRHSQAANVKVLLWTEIDTLCLHVQDNGPGFDAEAARRSGGSGLAGMEQRARLLGGTLLVETAPSHGTLISVRLPIRIEVSPSLGE